MHADAVAVDAPLAANVVAAQGGAFELAVAVELRNEAATAFSIAVAANPPGRNTLRRRSDSPSAPSGAQAGQFASCAGSAHTGAAAICSTALQQDSVIKAP